MNKEEWYPALLAYLMSFEQVMPSIFNKSLFPKLVLPIYYPEDTVVLKPGDVAVMAYWPITGYIRTYVEYKPEPDREQIKQKTIAVSVPGKVSLASNSFMNQSKSEYFMEITRGSTIVGFSRKAFMELGKKMPEIFMLANQIVAKESEERDFEREMRAVERALGYQMFLDHYGIVAESFIFLKDIASFIGMSQETLSRIRTAGGYADAHLRK